MDTSLLQQAKHEKPLRPDFALPPSPAPERDASMPSLFDALEPETAEA